MGAVERVRMSGMTLLPSGASLGLTVSIRAMGSENFIRSVAWEACSLGCWVKEELWLKEEVHMTAGRRSGWLLCSSRGGTR